MAPAAPLGMPSRPQLQGSLRWRHRVGALLLALLPVAVQAAPPPLILRLQGHAAAGCLRQGALRVEAAVRPAGAVDGQPVTAPRLQVRVGSRLVGQLEGLATAGPPGAVVQIAEMDPANPFPEVLLSSFSGGAHCCRRTQVLRADAGGRQWRELSLGPLNGGPAVAEDPLGDGRFRLVDADNRFLYRFGCYACGTTPVRVWELQGDRFVDVSHLSAFQPLHRRWLAYQEEWFALADPPDANAFLAGYVASKALVGEFDDGWQRMLRHHDRRSRWGLSLCEGGRDADGACLGRERPARSFPQALRAFLVDTGYLSPAPALPAPASGPACR